jgi:hypothetical protein
MPEKVEAEAVVQILQTFGAASGLHCSLAKSSASPISCEEIDLQPILAVLQCPVRHFPVQYLGLPLSLVRLSKRDLWPLVDKVAGHVLAWKASLLERSVRPILLDSTMAATPIYHMLSLDLPPWFFNWLNQLLKGLFWSAATKDRNA